MAVCSGDRFVQVWDLTDSGEWKLTAKWQAHRGAVTSISWAHPEFGTLLATAGADQEAKVWEERSIASSLASRWTMKVTLGEARRAVTCVEFAPRHLGLKLAVGSEDGCVRIYEAVDIMNLSQWPLAAALQSFSEENRLGCSCLSWCTGRFEPPTLVAGGSHLVVYRYSQSTRAWQQLLQISPEKGDILDVAWAPNVGRRFHYIASAENRQLRVFKLDREMIDQESSDSKKSGKLTLAREQIISTNAWQCQWNVTGTVLSSAGNDGLVQFWKADADGTFEEVANVQGDLNKKY